MQVFRLTLYKAKALHFYILPSQFPNDRLSPTNIKTSMHTATGIVRESHSVPFSPAIPKQYSRHIVWKYSIARIVYTLFVEIARENKKGLSQKT